MPIAFRAITLTPPANRRPNARVEFMALDRSLLAVPLAPRGERTGRNTGELPKLTAESLVGRFRSIRRFVLRRLSSAA
jgi:hypothetical protein